MKRHRILTLLVLAIGLVALGIYGQTHSQPANYTATDEFVTVHDGPANDSSIELDTSIFVPKAASATQKRPAVILSHGLGGSKLDEKDDAVYLATHGYVALTYSARGFGHSGGVIALDSPDYEVKDVEQLIDHLATRSDVQLDGPNDPRVGLIGTSYGGGISLLVPGYDKRVDATIPILGWNDLRSALNPNYATINGSPAGSGVFKKEWAANLFTPFGSCQFYLKEVCDAYNESAETGNVPQSAEMLLARSSPSSVITNIKTPVMVVQGERDSLFPLTEAASTTKALMQQGTPFKLVWMAGGHDAPLTDSETKYLHKQALRWFDHYLSHKGGGTGATFDFAQPNTTTRGTANEIPGAPSTIANVQLQGRSSQPVFNPPGGLPAGISSTPGLSQLSSAITSLSGIGGSTSVGATYQSDPLTHSLNVAGMPTLSLSISSSNGDAVLFAKLYDVDPNGKTTLPGQIAAPIRISGANQGKPVEITLPAISYTFPRDHRVRLVLSPTDRSYASPMAPATYLVSTPNTTGVSLSMPTAKRQVHDTVNVAALLGTLAVILFAVILLIVGRARSHHSSTPVEAAPPLNLNDLTKTYNSHTNVVDHAEFTIESGQIVGLLGPNGAGKTTTLRMILGLVKPTSGNVIMFGRQVSPGAPILSNVGALVEGPGLLPHVSGLANLTSYWAASGRPLAEAHLEHAIEIADLGDDIHRPVRTYSHGMRQRLAIAQATLGLPKLLILDEPANGLDPPQIRRLRDILHEYVQKGNSVLLSSHLLAEVEIVCSHVIVMQQGKVIATGEVNQITGTRDHLEDAFFSLLGDKT